MSLQLLVIAGPDKGRSFPLHPGPDLMLGRSEAPGDDLAFAVLALLDAAGGAMRQIAGVREGLFPRLREALAFDFEGRGFVEAQGRRAVNGLTEAQDAVSKLALRLPDLTERTEQ